MKKITLSLGAALLLVLISCRGCGESGVQHILDIVPRDARELVLVDDLTALTSGFGKFFHQLTRKQGQRPITALKAAVAKQLGFDIFGADAWNKVGIDASMGAVMFSMGAKFEPVVAVKVDDRGLFESMLRGLVERIDGGNQTSQTQVGDRVVYMVGRPFGTEVVPVIRWSYDRSFALLALGRADAELHAALDWIDRSKQSPQSQAMRTDPALERLQAKIAPSLLTVFGKEPQEGKEGSALYGITGVRFSATGLAIDMVLETGSKVLYEVLRGDPVLGLASHLEENAVVIGMTRGLTAKTIAALDRVPKAKRLVERALGAMSKQTGVDAKTDILGNLAGPATVAVHLQDVGSLVNEMKKGRKQLGALLRGIHVSVTAGLSDPVKMSSVLSGMAENLKRADGTPRFVAKDFSIGKEAAKLYHPRGDSPHFGWGIMGKTYVYGAGKDRALGTMQHLGKGTDGARAELAKSAVGEFAKRPDTSVLLVRCGLLADAAESWMRQSGTSQSGVGLGKLADAVMSTLRALGDVGVGLTVSQDSLTLTLREQIQ